MKNHDIACHKPFSIARKQNINQIKLITHPRTPGLNVYRVEIAALYMQIIIFPFRYLRVISRPKKKSLRLIPSGTNNSSEFWHIVCSKI
ncbi:hypothetical protein EUGRSUZ_A01052 [Eucalyptus grandis]|uniref:Uncharacterized protein n=2 Tax=Eucalyptus grandis TaxID=71139 RepID=A0ACC3M3X3_EUCGR|nr:hypothetical protein EUGRSUZ_A01052 [Eucalyptus grandis]